MREASNRALTAEDGLRLNLVDFGGDREPALLLLHGSFGHSRVWDFVVDALDDVQGVYALDLPGHGHSEHAKAPGRYGFDELVKDVRVAVEATGGKPVLAGHSIGSAIAMHYGARFPETVSGIVFLDIDPLAQMPHIERLRGVGGSPPKQYDTFEGAVARESRAVPGATREVHEHLARHGFQQEGNTWTQRFDQAFLRAVEQWDEREDLGGISVPALVMRGAESTVMSPEAVGFMVERLPDARAALIPGAGHQLHMEDPAAVAWALTEFVEDVQATSKGEGS